MTMCMYRIADVHVWDLSSQLANLETPGAGGAAGAAITSTQAPLHTFSGHREEGYAMDW